MKNNQTNNVVQLDEYKKAKFEEKFLKNIQQSGIIAGSVIYNNQYMKDVILKLLNERKITYRYVCDNTVLLFEKTMKRNEKKTA